MRVAVTGTPGTGKTTASALLEERLEPPVIHLTELIETEDLYTTVDEDRDSLVADIAAIEEELAPHEDAIIESHLAHHLPADRVVVLRCHPAELERRLADRGMAEQSITENAESEALDGILVEAIEVHDTESVFEIETTDRSPEAVADEIQAVYTGSRDPSVGVVDYTDYLT